MSTRFRQRRSRRGVALIFILLVMAVLITLVATLSTSSKIDIVEAQNMRNDEQNQILLDSARRLVEHVLLQDLQSSKFDSRREAWARPVQNLKFGDTTVSWEIVDEGGKLNVNLLAFGSDYQKQKMQEVLARLVKRVADENGVVLHTAAPGSPIIILKKDPYDAAIDGIVSFLERKVQDAVANGVVVVEDEKIRVLRPILFEVDELIDCEGMTPELLYGYRGHKGLADYLTVWSDGPVNINTAMPQVLQALSEDLKEDGVKAIEDYLAGNDFAETEDLLKVEAVDSGVLEEMKELVGVTSRFFIAHITVKTGNLERKAQFVLRRPDIAKVAAEEAPPVVSVIYYKSGV